MTIVYGLIAIITGLVHIVCRWSSGPLLAVATAPLVASLAVFIAAMVHVTVPRVLWKRKHPRHNSNTGTDRTTY